LNGTARPAAAAPFLVLGIALLAVSHGAIFARLADAPALAIAAWRLTLASAVVIPCALAFGARPAGPAHPARAIVAGLLLALHFAFWIASLDHTSIARSVLLVSTSPICRSTRCSGLREVMGSWKIIPISFPRIDLISSSGIESRSSLSTPSLEKKIFPFLYRAVFDGSNLRIDNAVTDLPEPDSPTMARISPRFTSSEICLTAE